MERILIVEDEAVLLKGLKFSILQDGYEVDTAMDGNEALQLFSKNQYNLVLLDVMLPGKDGFEVCKEIRKTSFVPIIMLTAKTDDESVIQGLEAGADDYVSKPFNILELKARIKAVMRRFKPSGIENVNGMDFGDFKINFFGRKIIFPDREETLTAKEFDLLIQLVMNEEKVFSREYLLETIWGYEYFGDVRTVDVHIRRLREKIEENSSRPKYIHTKWGTGYYFKR